MTVKVKVAKVHASQLKDEEIVKELEGIQEYFNENNFDFAKDTVNYVFLKGLYSHIKRTMIVIGVYVNNTKSSIYGLSSSLKLNFKSRNAEIATANAVFDENFIGELKPMEGMLIHMEIPVRGLSEDEEFSADDITGRLDDIKFINSKLQ